MSAPAAVKQPVSALNELFLMLADAGGDFSAKVYGALSLGCRRFGVSTGVLYRMENGDAAEVVAAVSPGDRIVPGSSCLFHAPEGKRAEGAGLPVFPAASTYMGVPVMVNGSLYGFLAFFDDSPARPMSEEDLELGRLLAFWLGSEIARTSAEVEREAAIAALRQNEASLAEARDAALDAARVKAEFLANVSHEIRTPMNGLLGMAALLLETPLADEQRQFVHTIRSSASALLSILNDVLDVSKLEAGKLRLESEPFDLVTLAEEVAALFAPQAAEKGVELVADIAAYVPEAVMGDSTRLRQVLNNLVGNAVKFTHAGHVVLEVRSVVEDGAPKLRFAVSDTGIGIAADRRSAIFESFTQADGSTTRQYGGTGLGLTICRQVLELMGAEIELESRVGQGSRFWFSVALPPPPPHVRRPAVSAPRFAGRRVLVASDTAPVREAAVALTRGWGCHADGCAAAELPAALEGRRYDALLLDTAATAGVAGEAVAAGPPVVLLVSPRVVGGGGAGTDARVRVYKPLRRAALRAALGRIWEDTPEGGGWDRAALLRACGGDAEIAREVLTTFLQSAPPLVERAASRATDAVTAARTLRSGAVTIGATVLAEACARVEAGPENPAAGDALKSAWEVSERELCAF